MTMGGSPSLFFREGDTPTLSVPTNHNEGESDVAFPSSGRQAPDELLLRVLPYRYEEAGAAHHQT